ncbi:MAG: hypothetical protein INH12_26020 [Cupriavidus sp.]|nr:hypothetical protein [Cupriavidus sp.]MCA3193537.1 hypothetical protein [Cupriavidus sp.]MCA3199003.1 hypothetical protein [Cupriavidus sp.]MCA3203414.1 hypothetical protein [Cupriavidus sp.]MCA3209524.1 hypothetical protein [Cupriavidus sp.]
MGKIQVAAPKGMGKEMRVATADQGPVHRLRAVVATYRTALQAYTLVVSADTLMALSNGPEPAHSARDYRAQAHLDRLRHAVHDCGLALPSAIVVAVAGGTMRCECDHLYSLDLDPRAGDSLIVLDGYDRLAELVNSGRGQIKTLVTAVLCSNVSTAAEPPTPATEADCAVMHVSAAARWAGATRVWQ